MIIRHRLAPSFLVVLLMLGTNVAMHSWGSARKASAIDALRRAVTVRELQKTVERDLRERAKEVEHLTETVGAPAAATLSIDHARGLKARLDDISAKAAEMATLAAPESRARLDAFSSSYAAVKDSWVRLCDRLTAQERAAQARAFEDAMRGAGAGRPIEVDTAPLVLDAALPPVLSIADATRHLRALQEDEQARVERATANLDRVTTLVDRLSLTIMIASGLAAVGMAYGLSRKRSRRRAGDGGVQSRVKS